MTEQLLAALRRRANWKGGVFVRDEVLMGELRCQAPAIRAGLTELEKAGAIDLITPPPFIVLKLKMWPGSGSKPTDSEGSAYSYSKQLFNKHAMKADSYRPGELAAHDGLLHEILGVLGEDDPTSFRRAIDHYAPDVIRAALDRVRRAKNIRKSRTALFRHLLPRIARDSQPTR